ncbi:MAG: alpha/beta fold hydrolase [Desulfobacteraceae bacterium]
MTRTEVSQLYVLLFGRASEGQGNVLRQSCETMETAAEEMLNSPEAGDYFGADLNTNQAFIEHIYLHTLNKTIADDFDGICYWVGLLDAGVPRSRAVAALAGAIRDYAPDVAFYDPGDAPTVAAHHQFINRVRMSDYIAQVQWEPLPDHQTTTRFGPSGLNVTDDPSSFNQAKRLFAGPDAPWRYLVEATELQTLQPIAFKSLATLIGQNKLSRHFEYPVKIVRLVYETDYKGRKILGSGLFCQPLSHDEESFPMMVLQNGMNFADSTAPSQFSYPDRFIGLEFLASAGYFVIIPDWIGFGTSSDILFPMNNARYAASATIDMIKAAEEYITAQRLTYNDHIFMAGYSMGAYVTSASLRAIEARDFRHITAAAIGAGGYDLVGVLDSTLAGMNILTPSQLAMVFASYNDTYEWNRPLTDFFNLPFALVIPELISGNYSGTEIDQHLSPDIDTLLNPEFAHRLTSGRETDLIDALRENSVHNWAPLSSLRLYHAANDERIPFADSWNTFLTMQDAGSRTVEFEELVGINHFHAVFDFLASVLPWFETKQEENNV